MCASAYPWHSNKEMLTQPGGHCTIAYSAALVPPTQPGFGWRGPQGQYCPPVGPSADGGGWEFWRFGGGGEGGGNCQRRRQCSRAVGTSHRGSRATAFASRKHAWVTLPNQIAPTVWTNFFAKLLVRLAENTTIHFHYRRKEDPKVQS